MKSRFFGLVAIVGFFSLMWLSTRFAPNEAPKTEDVAFLADVGSETLKEVKTEVSFADFVQHKRECVTAWMDSQLGIREKSNRNDHPRINEYFVNLGWKNVEKLKHHTKAWCGAFMANAWLSCIQEIPWVKSNAELAQVRKWKTGPAIEKRDAQPGDVVSITLHSHVEGVYDRHPNPEFPFFTAIGGNTSAPPGDTDRREGVHKKTRMWAEVNKVISLEQTLLQIEKEHIS